MDTCDRMDFIQHMHVKECFQCQIKHLVQIKCGKIYNIQYDVAILTFLQLGPVYIRIILNNNVKTIICLLSFLLHNLINMDYNSNIQYNIDIIIKLRLCFKYINRKTFIKIYQKNVMIIFSIIGYIVQENFKSINIDLLYLKMQTWLQCYALLKKYRRAWCKRTATSNIYMINLIRRHQNTETRIKNIINIITLNKYNKKIVYVLSRSLRQCGNYNCQKKIIKMSYDKILTNIQKYGTMYKIKHFKIYEYIYKFKKCSHCQASFYCSKHCQKISWNKQNHKLYCTQL